MEERSRTKQRWRWIALFIGFWTALALLHAAEMYVSQLMWEKEVPWALALRRAFKEIYAYAFLTIGVFWLCNRLRLEPEQRSRWILQHMAAAIGFSLAHVALVCWLETGEISVQTGELLTFSFLFKMLWFNMTTSNLFKYWIFVLGHLSWQYYQRYRERERQSAALATELVQARLQALRMQINPHFLFNTLHTISSLIHSQPEMADRMIARLSDLLRATLDHGQEHEVPLREEIEFLRRYLDIEQMRFSDRLRVIFNIDANAEELLVPHLILQPLVENALRHGVEPREEAGRIEISARVLDGKTLELKVCDNGGGLPPNTDGSLAEGIGLSNVRSRLGHLYGATQRFEIRNATGGGVEATVTMPCCCAPRSPLPLPVAERSDDRVIAAAGTPAKVGDC